MTGLSSTLADDAPYRRPRQRGARERELLLVDVQTARSSPNSQAAPRLQGSAISHDSQPTHAPASETPCDWRDCCPLGSAFRRLHPNPGPVHLAAIPTPLQSQSHLRIYFKENSVHASKPFAFSAPLFHASTAAPFSPSWTPCCTSTSAPAHVIVGAGSSTPAVALPDIRLRLCAVPLTWLQNCRDGGQLAQVPPEVEHLHRRHP